MVLRHLPRACELWLRELFGQERISWSGNLTKCSAPLKTSLRPQPSHTDLRTAHALASALVAILASNEVIHLSTEWILAC